jgi:hypothetical protein
MRTWAILLSAGSLLFAQTGQEGSRPEWPCVAGRAVDSSYIDISESTGGQIFLFQKGEVGQATLFLTADRTHPATVVRAVGMLSDTREFEFPVDSTIRSLLILVSIQCRKSISVFRPSGSEMTAANSTQNVDLQAGRGLKIDDPEPGKWKLRLQGTGLFVASVRAQSPIRISGVEYSDDRKQPLFGLRQQAIARVSGEPETTQFQLVDAAGDVIAPADTPEAADGKYLFPITPTIERFRIRMTAVDGAGWPVQRTHPVLFRAQPQPQP